MKSGVYIIKNVVTEKLYVGSTNNFPTRWKRHVLDLNRGNHTGTKLQRAWIKYGQSAFEFSIIEYVEDSTLLMAREQHWLDTLRAVDFGYNTLPTAGSNRGHKLSEAHKIAFLFTGHSHSEESKKKMSIAAQNRVVSEETKLKISVSKLGKPMAESTKEKMRVLATGRTHSEETKQLFSLQRKGRKMSEQTRLNMSAAAKGKVYSEETKLKLSIAATLAHARKKAEALEAN